ncbi:MAG: hypothetical protein IT473_02050 [Lysobacter sp.]|nr:hypothetical protein [Lysobacter sp.]
MPVPSFDDIGLLPAGIHDVSFAEIETAMCWNSHRQALWLDFRRFLQERCQLLVAAGVPFLIDGSFVRRKEFPSDIDLVIDVTGCSDEIVGVGLLLRFNHRLIKAEYHVDQYLRHPTLLNDLSSFFQYAGDKCAVEMHIDPKHPKGILRATS